MKPLNLITLILTIVGGINWGLVGLTSWISSLQLLVQVLVWRALSIHS